MRDTDGNPNNINNYSVNSTRISKSVIRRLEIQRPESKPDQETNIREAFEKTVQYKNAHSKQQVNDRYFLFSIGAKAMQSEIEEFKSEFSRVDSEKDDLLLELSKRDKQIESMKNCFNCWNNRKDSCKYKERCKYIYNRKSGVDKWQQK